MHGPMNAKLTNQLSLFGGSFVQIYGHIILHACIDYGELVFFNTQNTTVRYHSQHTPCSIN
jgi:hypothetical protein